MRKVATSAEAGRVHHCDVLVVNACWQELAEECPRLGSFWDHCRGLGPEELRDYGLLRSILVNFFFPLLLHFFLPILFFGRWMIPHALAGAPLWPRPQRQRAEKMMCVTFIFLTLAAWRLGFVRILAQKENL